MECFIRLCDNLSFTKTAELMFMSQSTVTREIKALENELGFKLFRRSVHSVEITKNGLEFKDAITPLLNSMNTVVSRIKNLDDVRKSTIRMGFYHIASLKNIPDAIGKFHKKFPHVSPEIHQANLNNLNKMYHNGQLDCMFAVKTVLNPEEGDCVRDIYKGEFVATIPVSNPLSEKEFITPDMLNGQDILLLNSSAMSTQIEAMFRRILFKCDDAKYISCTTTDEQEVYLRAGIGITISTNYSFKPSSKYKQIKFVDPAINNLDCTYSVMYRKDENANHIEEFIDILCGKRG